MKFKETEYQHGRASFSSAYFPFSQATHIPIGDDSGHWPFSKPHAHLGFRLVDIIRGVDSRRRQAVQHKEEGEQDHGNDGEAAKDGLPVSKVCPLAAGVTQVALNSVVAQFIIYHAAKGKAVTEELEAGNLGAPDDHGSNNQQHILENATEGHHEAGCFTDL